ncbi:cell division inhibitor MinD-like [Halanaeroarchaeum sulfurireducens]|uniref:Cell division inhibitor MinD-like n=1 Tax=Halanaeroarchaeum sulfurireducens TaxID=1604004 RepID=A0A0F7P8X5_9EURY|nr:cell division inhibitor MinD-like [Halanaeroarchaeum sulfurireducens]ALG81052.1 cell division inhibitor MinD-like [Halanaeroarchaeum sulfurireducens]
MGKSTVSLALGHVLDAVVVDADLTMADLPVDAGPTLQDVLADRARAVPAVRDGWAVAVLPAARSLTSAHASDPASLVDVLARLDEAYGTVVVDGPAGLGADAALPMTVADACVLVTTPATAAVADAVRTRELARELEAGIGAVVLNRVRDRRPPIERRLGGPVVTVPESGAVATATTRGVPVTLHAPDATAAERFRQLAGRLNRVTRRSRFER